MNVTPDTNVLVRFLVVDDEPQALRARAALVEAEAIALTLPALCETAWVLRSVYRLPAAAIADRLRDLTEMDGVIVDHDAVAAGLAMLSAGADFTDGVIAQQGAAAGGATFLTFDRAAAAALSARGHATRVP